MLESCHATQSAHVEAGHAGIMREEVDTFALNMNTCPDGMMQMQQTPVKGSPGEAYDHQQFKTPSANPSHLLHWQHLKTPTSSGSRHHRTPRSLPRHDICKTPGDDDSVSTTGGAIYNPFESALLERLQGPLCSPSVFAQGSTPGSAEKTPKTFRWTIDQIAILKPADIEEMPLQQALMCAKADSHIEEEAQKAIDTFFSKHVVLPSPWTDSAKKKPFQLPGTPDGESDDDWQYPPVHVSHKSATREISCQTTLTLPTEFDIFQLLAEHYTYQGDEGSQDLSTSSLRRKLFFQGTGTSPISPVKNGYSATIPADLFTPDRLLRSSPSQPPGSCLFSSSPIASPSSHLASSSVRRPPVAVPHMHRSCTTPDMMASPQLSPINTSCPRTRTCTRTKVEPPLQAAYVSPGQESPSQFWAHRTMESPGMSPISSNCPSHQKLPIVPLELQFCDDESTAPMRKVTGQKSSAADCTLDEVHQMELDTSSCGRDTSNCVRQTLFQNPTDDHFALDTEHSAHVSSQDIGYYTNSLTNQDTGFQSRNNLTNNDTEMLSVTNQDTGFQSGCSSTSSLISGPIVHSDLTNQFGQLPVVCDDLDPTFNDHLDNSHPVRRMSFSLDDDIIFRARKVLGKPPEGTLGQMSSKSVILSDVSNTLEKQDQMRESDVAMTMLKRAKDDFARYFESIESGSVASTPTMVTPSSKLLQQNYTSESKGWF